MNKENINQGISIGEHVVRVLEGDELPGRDGSDVDPGLSLAKYQHVFAVGCKGIPASYGGFESFMDKLTKNRMSQHIMYHVARISNDSRRFEYNGAACFDVQVPDIGNAKAILYDCKALQRSIDYCRRHKEIEDPVFFVMACRIGPFIHFYKQQILQLGGRLYVNPDGHEWKRAKWNAAIKKYWKFSERLMVKYSDLMICDSRSIESYIKEQYKRYDPKTTFIPYGGDIRPSVLEDNDDGFQEWLRSNDLVPHDYYLIVGRFVPENNYETIIREFIRSNTTRKLAIVTNDNLGLMEELQHKLGFGNDRRICFTGTVYNQELLKKIRENAFAYIHGHEVGGTNPSLLEGLSSTSLNLLNDVVFNTEVGGDAALYWNKQEGSLQRLIEEVEQFKDSEIISYGKKAKGRIEKEFLWKDTCKRYEMIFDN